MKVNQDGGVTRHLLSLAAPNEYGPAAGKVNLERRFTMDEMNTLLSKLGFERRR